MVNWSIGQMVNWWGAKHPPVFNSPKSNQMILQRKPDQFGNVFQVELFEDVIAVGFYGARANEKFFCDLFIR
jgi:hypothetical protein